MDSFKVVCVNDKFKPAELSGSDWIEKGKVYTVIDAKFMKKQNMSIGYKLEEITLPEGSPYKFFAANRFVPYQQDDALEAENAVSKLLEEVLDVSIAE